MRTSPAGDGGSAVASVGRNAAIDVDIFALIEDSHERVETLLDSLVGRWARFHAGRPRSADRVLLDRALQALRTQIRAEERVFYPRLPESTREEPAVREALAQHDELERRLDGLEVRDASPERALKELRNLKWFAEMHFEHEEDQVFEAARHVLDRETTERLGRDWLRSAN